MPKMTKPACRPILSSESLLNRDSHLSRSSPSFLQTQELNNSTSHTMPGLMGSSQPTLSGHCYGLPDLNSERLTTPKTTPAWQDLEAASDSYYLPARHRSRYERPNEEFSCSYEESAVGREAGSAWTEAGFYEASPPTFLPTPADSYHQFSGSQSFGDIDSQWNTPDYPSQFGDYPTPQSNLSLSPPQHVRGNVLTHGHTGGRYVAASRAAASHLALGNLPRYETSCSQQLRASSPGEDEITYHHDDGTLQPFDECDESDEDGSVHCEPYAQLIFRALKSAPGHRMVLKDIYRWFEKNTDKARKSSKGWQNSIRHNLSMNGVSLPCA